MLGKFFLGKGYDSTGMIKDNGTRAGSALVKSQDKITHSIQG
jgi:hypothetical protein